MSAVSKGEVVSEKKFAVFLDVVDARSLFLSRGTSGNLMTLEMALTNYYRDKGDAIQLTVFPLRFETGLGNDEVFQFLKEQGIKVDRTHEGTPATNLPPIRGFAGRVVVTDRNLEDLYLERYLRDDTPFVLSLLGCGFDIDCEIEVERIFGIKENTGSYDSMSHNTRVFMRHLLIAKGELERDNKLQSARIEELERIINTQCQGKRP